MSAKRRTKTAGKAGKKSPEPPGGGRVPFPDNPLKLEFLVACLILVAAICILYPQLVFKNDIFFASDNQAAASFSSVGKAALDAGVYPVWNPYVFSGMPSFASLQYTPYVYPVTPVLGFLTKYLFFPQYTWMLFHTLLIGLGTYLLLKSRGVHYLPAVSAGILMMWMPNLVAVGSHGHGTQACASGYLPIALLLWDRVWRGKGTVANGAALLIVLGLSMLRAHLQISYYTYALVALYILFYGVVRIIDGTKGRSPATSMLPRSWRARLTHGGERYTAGTAVAELGWAALVFAIIVGGSLTMSSVLHLPVHDYAQYSIRGASAGGGVDYQYATSWSLHPLESLTFLFPYAYGFGSNLYFGNMPFTDYPNYLGLVVFAFALASLFLVRTRFVKFLAFVTLVATFVAFGKFLPILYNPLFKFAPFFNKFRVPVMVLIVQQLAVVLLFGIGFDALMRMDRIRGRSLAMKALIVSGVILLLALVTLGYWSGGFADAVASKIRMAQNAQQQAALAREAGGLLGRDLVRFGVMCLAVSLLLYVFYARKLVPLVALALITGIGAVDLYLVNQNILHPEKFRGDPRLRIIRDESVLEGFDDPDDVARFFEKETRHFRVFPMESPRQPFSGAFRNNRLMNFGVSTIGGYQPAKLMIYEEFLQQALPASLSRGNYQLVDMLNVRYILSSAPFPEHPRFRAAWQGTNAEGRQQYIYENMGALPRVFLIDRYRVATGETALSLLGSATVNVRDEVILDREPAVAPRSREGATATVARWGFNEIRIDASLPDACILVLSEVYYPDWKATVDGEPADVLQANHILRALALPAGEHEIVFRYDTSLLKRGLTISVSTFAVALLALVGAVVVTRRRR